MSQFKHKKLLWTASTPSSIHESPCGWAKCSYVIKKQEKGRMRQEIPKCKKYVSTFNKATSLLPSGHRVLPILPLTTSNLTLKVSCQEDYVISSQIRAAIRSSTKKGLKKWVWNIVCIRVCSKSSDWTYVGRFIIRLGNKLYTRMIYLTKSGWLPGGIKHRLRNHGIRVPFLVQAGKKVK